MELVLVRQKTGDMGTHGVLVTPTQYFFSLELPWKDNRQDVSCIPNGRYLCQLVYSNKFKRKTYLLRGVPNRSWVRIHRGNYAGDESKGYRSDVEGCILIGTKRAIFGKQEVVGASAVALRKFLKEMDGEDFYLNITSEFDMG